MDKNQTEITITMSKTIQEKQFEPLAIPLTAKLIVDEKDIADEFTDGLDFLDEMILAKFGKKGLIK
jgi:hypothetical protein